MSLEVPTGNADTEKTAYQQSEKHGSINEKGVSEGGALPDIAADDLIPDGTLDPVYQAKARVLNDAMQEIGASIVLSVVPRFGADPRSMRRHGTVWPSVDSLRALHSTHLNVGEIPLDPVLCYWFW